MWWEMAPTCPPFRPLNKNVIPGYIPELLCIKYPQNPVKLSTYPSYSGPEESYYRLEGSYWHELC